MGIAGAAKGWRRWRSGGPAGAQPARSGSGELHRPDDSWLRWRANGGQQRRKQWDFRASESVCVSDNGLMDDIKSAGYVQVGRPAGRPGSAGESESARDRRTAWASGGNEEASGKVRQSLIFFNFRSIWAPQMLLHATEAPQLRNDDDDNSGQYASAAPAALSAKINNARATSWLAADWSPVRLSGAPRGLRLHLTRARRAGRLAAQCAPTEGDR